MSNSYNEILGLEAPNPRMVNVGHGNFLRADRIVAILEASTLPMKRLREKAGAENMLVDATKGRRMRSVIVSDSRHIFLSALNPQVIRERLQDSKLRMTPAQIEMEEGEFVS